MSFFKHFSSGDRQQRQQNEQIIIQTEAKMNQLIKSVEDEIRGQRKIMKDLSAKVGEEVYEWYKQGVLSREFTSDLESIFSEMLKNEKQIQDMEGKRNSIHARYEEELYILRKFQPQADTTSGMNKKCQHCGCGLQEMDIFCMNCGQKV